MPPPLVGKRGGGTPALAWRFPPWLGDWSSSGWVGSIWVSGSVVAAGAAFGRKGFAGRMVVLSGCVGWPVGADGWGSRLRTRHLSWARECCPHDYPPDASATVAIPRWRLLWSGGRLSLRWTQRRFPESGTEVLGNAAALMVKGEGIGGIATSAALQAQRRV